MLVSSFHVGDSVEIHADPSSHMQGRGPQRPNGSLACVHVCDVRRPYGAPLESDWWGACFRCIGKTPNVNIFCSVLRKDGFTLFSGGFCLTVAPVGAGSFMTQCLDFQEPFLLSVGLLLKPVCVVVFLFSGLASLETRSPVSWL